MQKDKIKIIFKQYLIILITLAIISLVIGKEIGYIIIIVLGLILHIITFIGLNINQKK